MSVRRERRISSRFICHDMFWVRDKSFYKNLIVLAVPIILQNVISFGVSLADNIMIGQLGEVPIAALHIGTKIQGVLQIILFGVESALIILSSQYWGKRDTDHIKDVISIALRLTFVVTAPMAFIAFFLPEWFVGLITDHPDIIRCCAAYLRILAVSYLVFGISMTLLCAMRSVEMVRIGLINSMVALFVNVILNYLLIFGNCGFPRLEVRGAAIATFIARFIELAVVAIFVRYFDPNLKMRLPDFKRWDPDIFHDLIKYGTPLMAGQVTWAVNQFCQTAIIGRMGGAVLASISIVGTLYQFLHVGVFGLAAATGIMTGKTIGAGEFEKMKTQARTMQAIFCFIGLCLGATVFFGNEIFLKCYKLEPETRAIIDSMMRVLVVVIAFGCYQGPCLMGLVKSGGDTSFVFKNDTFFVFCVVLPSAFIAMHWLHAPPWVVYACLLSDQVLKCFVAFVKINSFNWMKNLTRPKQTA